ncbi:hypothetical protein B0H11DRAFT_2014561 [Mycena galericulata]|nr:hypothetical protein B0H11DRAFT_2014561 [Mycena galericulata]
MAAAAASPQLWATASKEWVIQPKPKPGRKPKKDLAPVQQEEELVDSKGRRVQNRAAQRAFRERKQSQLADLQARVQSYEQGEIERNVALQNIAKRLKEENEMLRRENAALKEKLARAEQERDMPLDNDRKRWRDHSPASSVASTQRKKYKVDLDQVPRFPQPYISSPQSIVSSPDSNSSCDTRFPSVPFDPQADAFATFSNLKSDTAADTMCVCRDVFQQTSAGVSENKVNVAPVRSIVLGSPPPEETSILDNLPPYQPPVPLRLRPRVSTQFNTVFHVSPPSQPTPPNCSGDPSNCPACADDSFGKAFCEKISEISAAPCDNCPSASEAMSDVGSSQGITLKHPHPPLAIPTPSPSHPVSSFIPPNTETIPTNDAWQRLKSHPNVAFTDLAMLADVVARRSKCTGPRVMLSPPPEHAVAAGANSEQPILLTDPHAHFREKERARVSHSPPRVQEICGQRGIREVHAEGVRDALRLLDAKFQ